MYSKRLIVMLIAGAVLCAVLAILASRNAYFPTDIALARAIQAGFGNSTSWAKTVSSLVEIPACFVLLALTMLAAWLISGWRAALIAILVFFGLFEFGPVLSRLVAQPRPSPDLINVVGHPKGYSFPSISGLIFAATF